MTFLWAIVLFGLLIFFHELGHFLLAKLVGVKVLKFSLGFGPKLISRKIGDTEYILSALPLGGYVKPLGEEPGEELSEEEKPFAFNSQPAWKRAAIIIAGPVFNLVLAYIIFVTFLSTGIPVVIPNLDSISPTIDTVVEDSPAMKAGLMENDTIVAILDESIDDWTEMSEMISKNAGKELPLRINRGDEIIELTVTPEPSSVKDEEGKDIVVGRIGITKKLNFHVIESDGILLAPLKGAEALYRWCVLTLEVVVKLFSGSLSAKQVGGPILIVDAAAKAASVGLTTYFNFIAIISINLAVLNLLPVPVLDGGHLLFLSIEAIRRRPLSEKIMGVANRVGLTLLLMLIAFVFYNDITRIIVPWIQKILSQ
jgi:regulator of sigma E protease